MTKHILKPSIIILILFFGVINGTVIYAYAQYPVRVDEVAFNSQAGFENQDKAFKNPRGQGYYYAFFEADATNRITFYSSPDGVTWSLENTTIDASNSYVDMAMWEDEANNRLILYIIGQETVHFDLWLTAYAINDTGTCISNQLFDEEIYLNDDILLMAYSIEIDYNGYVWIGFSNEYNNKGKERHDVHLGVIEPAYPVDTPTNFEVELIYDGSVLTSVPSDHAQTNILALQSGGDVAFNYHVWTATGSRLYGVNATWNDPVINSGNVITIVSGFVSFGNGQFDATTNNDTDNDVWIVVHEDDGALEPIRVYRWNVSEEVSAVYGDDLEVDAGIVACTKGIGMDYSNAVNRMYVFWENETIGQFNYINATTINSTWGMIYTVEDNSTDFVIYSGGVSKRDYGEDGDILFMYCVTEPNGDMIKWFNVSRPPIPAFGKIFGYDWLMALFLGGLGSALIVGIRRRKRGS